MNNKLSGSLFAILITFATTTSVSADTINILFGNGTDTINYSFNTTEYDADGVSLYEFTFDTAEFNVGGAITTYSSSNYTLELGHTFSNSAFEVFSFSEDVGAISQMEFYGEIWFNDADGTFVMNPFGGVQPDMFAGANYTFNWDGETELLREFDRTSAYTTVSVSTISSVPVPAAVWLFGSGLIGLAGIARRKV